MGTSLAGTQIGTTYTGVLKTTDNATLTGTLRTISDATGVDSALQVSTGGVASSGTLASTGNFAVATNKFNVAAATGNTTVAGTFDTAGNFTVATTRFTVTAANGNTAIAGTLNVTGACIFSSTGAFTGNLSTSQTLTCRAFVQNDASGTSSWSGQATFGNQVTFNALAQFNSSVAFSGLVTFGGGISASTLTATSTSSLASASASSLTTTGAVTVGGNLAVNGNATLGDASGDSVTINAATITANNLAAAAAIGGTDTILAQTAAGVVKRVTQASVIGARWDSGNLSISSLRNAGASASISGAHTVGSVPSQVDAWLECAVANNGFSIGDRIPLWCVSTVNWGNNYFQLTVNSTTWFLTVNGIVNGPQMFDRSTGLVANFTLSDWRLRLFLAA